jgi:hypothetical protein
MFCPTTIAPRSPGKINVITARADSTDEPIQWFIPIVNNAAEIPIVSAPAFCARDVKCRLFIDVATSAGCSEFSVTFAVITRVPINAVVQSFYCHGSGLIVANSAVTDRKTDSSPERSRIRRQLKKRAT